MTPFSFPNFPGNQTDPNPTLIPKFLNQTSLNHHSKTKEIQENEECNSGKVLFLIKIDPS